VKGVDVTPNEISPEEAARALSDVQDRRRQVAAAAEPYPGWRWYFPICGLLTAGLFALQDAVGSPFFVPGGVAIMLATLGVYWVAHRQRRVKPRTSEYGVRGWALIAAATVVYAFVAALTLMLAHRSGTALPNTVTGAVAGPLIVVIGITLRSLLRRHFARRAGS
jgi:hypothetical protein